MKKQPSVNNVFSYLTYFLIFGVFMILVSGCEDEDVPADSNNTFANVQQSEGAVKSYIGVNANLQAARNMGSGIIPFADGNGFNGRAIRKGVTNLENARAFTDSVWFESCAKVDISISAGSFKIVIDYGEEGCEEDGDFIKGKLTETYTFANDSLTQETVYENFSFNDVTLDGSRSASFAISSLEAESFVVTWKEDLKVAWEDMSYTLLADMTSSFDGEEIVISGFTNLSSSNGESYKATINEDLALTLACLEEEIYAPVRGVETVEINNDSIQNYTVVIDYGDGACDYLVEITHDGESAVIDISEEYDEIEFGFGFIFGLHDDDDDYDDDKDND
ncbi:hypothetical protein QQ020_31550 [Fulvivirgaceae bacterium BMA12]|uniref:Lipoprotein n=1 Tax=Agaribacillus aureus TaxID=3051825 RepID=A0ABT8LI87_9BACT|nr:hypothetical protein [Fulvivirgaceae bacterium BMA12]